MSAGNNAFYYVDNAFYAALAGLEDEGDEGDLAPRVVDTNPYKPWDKNVLRQRRSRASHLKSLKQLSLQSVASNMDTIWCKDYLENWSGMNLQFLLGPFEQLAGKCTYDLMSELRNKNALHFRYLPTLITGNLQALDLRNLKNINKILTFVKTRCQNNLRSLNLENCTGITETVLASTLTSLKKLEQLNLKGTDVSDSILEAIGSCSFPLSCLNIGDNDKITNEGVERLCTAHFSEHMAAILLDFTSVDSEGLLTLLEGLPKLQVLEHVSLPQVILQWRLKFAERSLKLRQLKLNPGDFNIEELYLLVLTCPNLSDISFLPSTVSDSDALLPFLDVKKLASFVSDNSIVPEISWFMHMGQNLSKIEISGNGAETQVDLVVIWQFCPNLQTLELKKVNLVESNGCDQPFPCFGNLKSVSLGNKSVCNNVANSLIMILTLAFSLMKFELCLFKIPRDFFKSICNKSLQDERILSNLCEISFVKCVNLTEGSVNSLICCAPTLKKIHFHKNANSYYVDNFLAYNKLPIQSICDKTVDDDGMI